MKLNAIDAATRLQDLRLPPSNRLEALKEIVKGNTASASMTNGGFASSGKAAMRSRWKSSTIIEEES